MIEWMNEIYQSSSEMKELTKKKKFLIHFFLFMEKKNIFNLGILPARKKNETFDYVHSFGHDHDNNDHHHHNHRNDCHCGWKKNDFID